MLTISLLVLLTMVAIGVLSLSSVTLRSSAQSSSAAMARANARMALMLAIGDLQRTMGSDKAISAKSSTINGTTGQPNLVGAWQGYGWQGGTAAAPAAAQKESKFLRWLASTRNLSSRYNLSFAAGSLNADQVFLSKTSTTGTIAGSNAELKAERVPLTVGTARGGLAYVVSDETLKVPVSMSEVLATDTMMDYGHRNAPPATIPTIIDSKLKWDEPSRNVSLATAEIDLGADKTSVRARREELSTGSLGLLTDPVHGGLKVDLSPVFESTTSTLQRISTITGADTPYYTTADGAPHWDFLRSYYQLYRRATTPATPLVRLAATAELRPSSQGQKTAPTTAALLPVIAKMQIMFSMVSHHHHIGDRVDFHNTKGVPLGNAQHAVPHLVYDPVITLYNPYDVQLEFTSLRVRISDPPVGFQFQKHDKTKGTNPWYRQEFASGEYHGLARFQIANEKNTSARKYFTFQLKNKSASGAPGGTLRLLPGEVKVFSAYVEKNWTWGLETSGGYSVRSFFDWEAGANVGNIDKRSGNTYGVDAVPGIDFRAGLQTDHMSYGNGRPLDSRYDFEVANNWGGGFLSMRLTDDVTVNAKAQRCVTDASQPDFRVDLLAGSNTDANADLLRSYEFRFADVASELGLTSVITRRFRNSDILQKPDDKTSAGKSPFAILTMSAKTTRDLRDDSKAWLHNNFVTEGGLQDTRKIGAAAQSYDLRLQEITSYNTFPGVEIDPATDRGFFGAKPTSSEGVSVLPMYRVPLQPAASLGALIAANLVTSSQFPRVSYPLGNSFAHPLIPVSTVAVTSPINAGQKMLDHSYLMNASLWDQYYFSSAADNSGGMFTNKRTKSKVLSDFFTQTQPLLNARLQPLRNDKDPTTLASEFGGLTVRDQALQFARYAAIENPLNVNCDNAQVWESFLSSLRDRSIYGWNNSRISSNGKTAFVRTGLPVVGDAETAGANNTVNALGQTRWAGFRALSDAQIKSLASSIVTEIRERAKLDKAPCLSLGDFINRRLGASGDLHAQKGLLQTAIERSGINNTFHQLDSQTAAPAGTRLTGVLNPDALAGNTADGAPPILSQGDLLTALAPVITVRGDTFTIRAYGEARSADGATVLARAYCEATVQRSVEYVDPLNTPMDRVKADQSINKDGFGDLTETNKLFGRRFMISSFRWLSSSEI